MSLIKQWLSGELQRLRHIAPIRVIATVEAKCNLACHHCYWSHDIHEPHTSNWEAQATRIASMKAPVFYAGRILTPRGMNLLNACHSAGVKHFGIVDNGYTIFCAPTEWLHRFESINISIDGWREAHEKQRNKEGSFNVAWSAIRKLKGEGLDPIVSSAFSHMSFDGWDRFEGLLAENDVPMSSTLIYVTSPVQIRGTALYKDEDMVRKAFSVLRNGMPKLINIYALEHVRTLTPLFREMAWQPDAVDGDSLIARLENGVQVIYRPISIQWAAEVTLRWDGRFYPPTADGESSPVTIDHISDDYFKRIAELSKQELEVWSEIL